MSRLSAIGLMSGTSYDGVDLALLETDGEDLGRVGPTGYRPYSEQERAVLRRYMDAVERADLAGVAPAHLIVGSLDPLLDDSNNLAAKLKAASVPHDLTIYQGINHGFIRYGRLIGTARRAIADCAAALKAGLAVA